MCGRYDPSPLVAWVVVLVDGANESRKQQIFQTGEKSSSMSILHKTGLHYFQISLRLNEISLASL